MTRGRGGCRTHTELRPRHACMHACTTPRSPADPPAVTPPPSHPPTGPCSATGCWASRTTNATTSFGRWSCSSCGLETRHCTPPRSCSRWARGRGERRTQSWRGWHARGSRRRQPHLHPTSPEPCGAALPVLVSTPCTPHTHPQDMADSRRLDANIQTLLTSAGEARGELGRPVTQEEEQASLPAALASGESGVSATMLSELYWPRDKAAAKMDDDLKLPPDVRLVGCIWQRVHGMAWHGMSGSAVDWMTTPPASHGAGPASGSLPACRPSHPGAAATLHDHSQPTPTRPGTNHAPCLWRWLPAAEIAAQAGVEPQPGPSDPGSDRGRPDHGVHGAGAQRA